MFHTIYDKTTKALYIGYLIIMVLGIRNQNLAPTGESNGPIILLVRIGMIRCPIITHTMRTINGILC